MSGSINNRATTGVLISDLFFTQSLEFFLVVGNSFVNFFLDCMSIIWRTYNKNLHISCNEKKTATTTHHTNKLQASKCRNKYFFCIVLHLNVPTLLAKAQNVLWCKTKIKCVSILCVVDVIRTTSQYWLQKSGFQLHLVVVGTI